MFRKYVKGGFSPKFNTPPSDVPRLCLADDRPATFHRWMDDDQAFLRINCFVSPDEQRQLFRSFQMSGIVPHGGSVELRRATFALVEYSDGSVGKVKPELIQFLDREGD